MSKIISIDKTNAIFLATVLVTGIIALSSSSFMVGSAEAKPYYEMDNNYNSYQSDYGMDRYDDRKSYGKDNNYKSKDSSNVIVKKINKCNNININLDGFNGLKLNALPTSSLNGLATDEAQAAGEGIESSSSGNGGSNRPSGSDNGSLCLINNNNDNGVTPPPSPPCPLGQHIDPRTGLCVPDNPPLSALDLAVSNGDSDNVSILLGNGDGTFIEATLSPFAAGDDPTSVAVGDFDSL